MAPWRGVCQGGAGVRCRSRGRGRGKGELHAKCAKLTLLCGSIPSEPIASGAAACAGWDCWSGSCANDEWKMRKLGEGGGGGVVGGVWQAKEIVKS